MDSPRGVCLRCMSRQLHRAVLPPSTPRRPACLPLANGATQTPRRNQHTQTSHPPQKRLHSNSIPYATCPRAAQPATPPRPRNHATVTPASTPTRLTRLTHRRLLIVHGQDAAHFLQGLTTNNVPTTAASTRDGFYSAFLNAQGRLLHDVFVYPATASAFYQDALLPQRIKDRKGDADPGFVVEADAEGIQSLSKHLKRYKLRAKVELWVLDPGEATALGAFGGAALDGYESGLHAPDNRAPGFGTRLLAAPGSEYLTQLLEQYADAPLQDYHRARHVAGIPEGQGATGGEIPYAASLPHEMNVDLMGGVDFRKGCYVGQELTIRTQHKGVVRKRVLPVSLYPTDGSGDGDLVGRVQDWVAQGAVVDIVPRGRRGRPAGRWVAGVPSIELGEEARIGEVGLAMCRLEMMTDVIVEAGGEGGGVKFKERDEFVLRPKWEDGRKAEEETVVGVRAHVPGWVREGVERRLRRGGDRAVDGEGREEAVG